MKDARIKVLSALKPRMAERGCRYRADACRFFRVAGDFTLHWQTRFLAGATGVEVELGMGVRSETVERIFHQTSTFPPKSHDGTATIGGSLANLEGVGLKAYTYPVITDDDVAPVSEQLLALFDEKATPYFTRYSNLLEIDHLLNDQPEVHTPHCRYGLPRETRGLIVAKLVGRVNYRELEAYYRSRLMKINSGFYAQQFEALVASIASLRPSDVDAG